MGKQLRSSNFIKDRNIPIELPEVPWFEWLPTHCLDRLSLASTSWKDRIDRAWPGLCATRFPLRLPIEVPPTVLRACAGRSANGDRAVAQMVASLTQFELDWPGVFEYDVASADRRLSIARTDAPAMPIDALLFFILGADLVGASPIGTISGDFGPDFHDDTDRSRWRLSLNSLTPDDDDHIELFTPLHIGEIFTPLHDRRDTVEASRLFSHAEMVGLVRVANFAFDGDDDDGERMELYVSCIAGRDSDEIHCVCHSCEPGNDEPHFKMGKISAGSQLKITLTCLLDQIRAALKSFSMANVTWREACAQTDVYESIFDALCN